jgi:hypothetical protein
VSACLGVCNDADFNGCGSPEHQIDDQGSHAEFGLSRIVSLASGCVNSILFDARQAVRSLPRAINGRRRRRQAAGSSLANNSLHVR